MTNPTTNSDEFVIKLQGKAHLFEPLKISHNVEILAKGSITQENKQDKDDGGYIYTYKFEPIIVEVKNELGETFKARDVRSRSKQLRSAIWKVWREQNIKQDFEEYYDLVMVDILRKYIDGEI